MMITEKVSNSPKDFLINFGKAVKSERLIRKLTQKELAIKVGVSHEWICKIEKGKVNTISLNLIQKIKDILDIKNLKL